MTDKRGLVIAAATDGACSGNPGPGGWGALIRFEDGSVAEFGGYEPSTTNNRMELLAALAIMKELKNLPRHPTLTIRTDSKYLINGLSQWIQRWKSKGWRTSSGKPVLNQDLWKDLDNAQLDDVPLVYVKAHSGDPDNERVDAIAVNFSKGYSINLKSPGDLTLKKEINKIQEIESKKNHKDLPPPELKQLISRLDVVNHCANNGYGLTIVEIAHLIDEPLDKVEQRTEPWQWRDWTVEPTSYSLWRFQRSSANPNKE